MPRQEPRRTCVGCRSEREKSELTRIVRTADGETMLDPGGRVSGRGAYVCPSATCLDLAVKRKALERALKGAIPPQVLEALREAIAKE